MPISLWFREGLHQRVAEILLDPRTLARGYFRPDYVRDILARHKAGQGDYSRRILSLLILEIWHRTFADTVCASIRELDAVPAVVTTA